MRFAHTLLEIEPSFSTLKGHFPLKAVLLNNSDFLLTGDLLFIPVPNWEG
jgi:hypothetical protein